MTHSHTIHSYSCCAVVECSEPDIHILSYKLFIASE